MFIPDLRQEKRRPSYQRSLSPILLTFCLYHQLHVLTPPTHNTLADRRRCRVRHAKVERKCSQIVTRVCSLQNIIIHALFRFSIKIPTGSGPFTHHLHFFLFSVKEQKRIIKHVLTFLNGAISLGLLARCTRTHFRLCKFSVVLHPKRFLVGQRYRFPACAPLQHQTSFKR